MKPREFHFCYIYNFDRTIYINIRGVTKHQYNHVTMREFVDMWFSTKGFVSEEQKLVYMKVR